MQTEISAKKFKNKDKIIFTVVLIFLILQFVILNFQSNNENELEFCNDYLQPKNNVYENSNEIYFDFYNKNIIYQELDIFPEIQKAQCLSKQVESMNKDIIFTSNNLYNFFILSTILSLLLLFTISTVKNTFLYGIVSFISYFNITKIFFKLFFINYYFLLFILSLLIYNFVIKKTNFENKSYLKTYFFSVYGIVLFFDYELFQQSIIFFITIYFLYFKNTDFNNAELNLFKSIPIVYYILRILTGIFLDFNITWQRLSANTYQSNERYADTYYALNVLHCNAVGCDVTNNYGPIWEYLPIKNNFEVTSIIFSTFIILFVQIIYLKLFRESKTDKFLLQFLFVAPPLVFVLERGHLDVYFVLLSLLAILLFKKNRWYSYALLSFTTLIKVYPIFLFAGMICYFYKEKQKKYLIETFITLFFNAISLIIYYFAVDFGKRIQDQSGITQSYGLQSHAKNYAQYLNLDFIFGYITQIIIILFIVLLLVKYSDKDNLIASNLIYLSFTGLFLIHSVFGNEDVRLIILYIPLIYILSKKTEFLTIAIIYLIASSPSKYFNGFDNIKENFFSVLLETAPIVISHFSFFIIYAYLFYEFILYLFPKIKSSY